MAHKSLQQLCCSSMTRGSRKESRLLQIAIKCHTREPKRVLQAGPLSSLIPVRFKMLDARDKDIEEIEQKLMKSSQHIFNEAAKRKKDKETFRQAVTKYLDHQGVQRRGHTEFIYSSLEHMKEFQSHEDIETYRMILDLFPKNKMKVTNTLQLEFMHFPKQQQCCIDVLDYMGKNGVIPDDKMGNQLIEIFGKRSHAFRKYQRMMYWMPKLRNISPYWIPFELPDCHKELAKMALKRMSVDLEAKIYLHETYELESETAIDQTFVAFASSPKQEELLSSHPEDKPLYIEGGFVTWLRNRGLIYFVLKSEVSSAYNSFSKEPIEDADDTTFSFNIFGSTEEPSDIVPRPSVHEQEDGTILGMCITGTGSKDSLSSWLKLLEKRNPILSRAPVIFTLNTPETGLTMYRENEKGESILIKT